jgi:predicted PurR-regulated permease PerM
MDGLFTPLQRSLITWTLILITGWLTLNTLSYFSELISILVTAGLVAFLLNYPVTRLSENRKPKFWRVRRSSVAPSKIWVFG